ncbi:MAG TPA: hypothetical protein DG753_00935 [Clostridium sp.]|nr:hypothetical protein [Clostridium sp.]
MAENRNTDDVLNNSIKLLNLSDGNIKEIGKISDLFDENKDEHFYNVSGVNFERVQSTKRMPGPRFGKIAWGKSGTSLFYTYKYTSKEDGQNYTDTYVVTFDSNN